MLNYVFIILENVFINDLRYLIDVVEFHSKYFLNQRSTSDSEFIEPCPKDFEINSTSLHNLISTRFEKLEKDPSSDSEGVNQCNTIIHGPNSPCLESKINTPTCPLPNTYHGKLISQPTTNSIQGT